MAHTRTLSVAPLIELFLEDLICRCQLHDLLLLLFGEVQLLH